MSDLANISFDDMETKIMSILWANQGKEYSQFTLFNKLIEDKYDIQNLKCISPDFKAKFLLVLRNLKSRYDDLEINKNNNTFYIKCGNETNSKPNIFEDKEYVYDKTVDNSFPCVEDYIIDNNIEKEFKYVDPFDGNTIFHNLVLLSNVKHIQKLINEDKFQFFIKNKNNQTPIQLSTDINITNIILSGMVNKIYYQNMFLETEVHLLRSKNSILDKKVDECAKELELIKKPKKKNIGYYFFIVLVIAVFLPFFIPIGKTNK
jgi:hypothetical protein